MSSTTPSAFITIADAAATLSVSSRTVRRLVASGKLTAYRVGPQLVRIDAAELAALPRRIPTAGSSR